MSKANPKIGDVFEGLNNDIYLTVFNEGERLHLLYIGRSTGEKNPDRFSMCDGDLREWMEILSQDPWKYLGNIDTKTFYSSFNKEK